MCDMSEVVRGQKRVSESLELEIQAVVNHPVQMLGSELGFSARAVHSWLLSQLSAPSPNPILPPRKYLKCQLWFHQKSWFSKELLTDAHTGTSAAPQITSGHISATLLTSTSNIRRALLAESPWRGGDTEDGICSNGTWDRRKWQPTKRVGFALNSPGTPLRALMANLDSWIWVPLFSVFLLCPSLKGWRRTTFLCLCTLQKENQILRLWSRDELSG